MKLMGLQYGLQTHFGADINSDWTILEADTGSSVAIVDSVGGGIDVISATTDNNEAYVWSTTELFKFANGKPLIAEIRLQFAEIATNDANVIFGLMDAVGANSLLDDGAGPDASYSGAVFFKEDGQTLWTVENSLAGTQKTTQLTAANSLDKTAHTAGSAAGVFHLLRIESDPISATDNRISFFIDGVLVARHTGQTTASAADMSVFFGNKTGDAATETLRVTDCGCHQLY